MIVEMTKDETLAALFKALGDATRLRIFEMLRCCEREVAIDETGGCRPANGLSVGEVCCQLGQSMSTVSFHLKELRLARLIRTEKRGRFIYCSVNQAALDLVRGFLDEPCCLECGVSPTEPIQEVILGR
jgi:DNA-binding transcriptional ArsR family regulator